MFRGRKTKGAEKPLFGSSKKDRLRAQQHHWPGSGPAARCTRGGWLRAHLPGAGQRRQGPPRACPMPQGGCARATRWWSGSSIAWVAAWPTWWPPSIAWRRGAWRGVRVVVWAPGNQQRGRSAGLLMLRVFASMTELERNLVRERTAAGLAAARALGRNGGRPAAISPTDIAAARRQWRTRRSSRSTSPPGWAFGIWRSKPYKYCI